MKPSTTRRDDLRPPLDDLQRAAREVGEALARARGRAPQSFLHGLPSWYSMLPPALAVLFAGDDLLWTQIATHHGMTLDEWRDSLLDLFEPMKSTLSALLRFRCTGCGAIDETVWDKAGVQHWRGREGEAIEVVCGEWQPVSGVDR
jgi:hypothetical protein